MYYIYIVNTYFIDMCLANARLSCALEEFVSRDQESLGGDQKAIFFPFPPPPPSYFIVW